MDKRRFMLKVKRGWILDWIECEDNSQIGWWSGRAFGRSLDDLKTTLLSRGFEFVEWDTSIIPKEFMNRGNKESW